MRILYSKRFKKMDNDEFTIILYRFPILKAEIANYIIHCNIDEFLVECIDCYSSAIKDLSTEILMQEIDCNSRQDFINYMQKYNCEIDENTIVTISKLKKIDKRFLLKNEIQSTLKFTE